MAQGDLRRGDDGAIQGLPAGDSAQIKAAAQLLPQAGFAARFGQRVLEQLAAALLDLIDQKRQRNYSPP